MCSQCTHQRAVTLELNVNPILYASCHSGAKSTVSSYSSEVPRLLKLGFSEDLSGESETVPGRDSWYQQGVRLYALRSHSEQPP